MPKIKYIIPTLLYTIHKTIKIPKRLKLKSALRTPTYKLKKLLYTILTRPHYSIYKYNNLQLKHTPADTK